MVEHAGLVLLVDDLLLELIPLVCLKVSWACRSRKDQLVLMVAVLLAVDLRNATVSPPNLCVSAGKVASSLAPARVVPPVGLLASCSFPSHVLAPKYAAAKSEIQSDRRDSRRRDEQPAGLRIASPP